MICYNCGNVLTNSDYCSSCKMDVSVYKRIVKLSNSYYNAGLTKAKNRDLAGAVDTLRRSVKLNKRNIDARNLLGLVYFEMGESVQAFSEWVMSTNIQPDNNPADKYLLAFQQEKGKVTELNHTIKKFNIALDYAKKGTDDMAIIQLKKVLNQNPNLIKASQLLCLMYMKHGQYERAKKVIKKSLKIDRCNPLSIQYLREIYTYLEDERKNDPETGIERRRGLRGILVDRPYLSGNDVIVPQNSFKEALSGAKGILHIVVGLLLGIAFTFFVITPGRVAKMTEDVNDVKKEYNQKFTIKNSMISELENQVDTLTTENESLKNDLGQYTDTDSTVATNYANILKAVDAYLDGDYDKSADAFANIDTSLEMNSNAFDNVYETLSSKLEGQVTSKAYNAGKTAMNAGDYDEAIAQFKKCLSVDSKNVDAMYYLAWSYSHNGDNTNAQKYFKEIADNYPNSEYYDVAKNQVVPE